MSIASCQGAVSPDGRWVGCRPTFFLPVKPLTRLFRRLFLDGLVAAFRQGRIQAFGDLVALRDPRAFAGRIGGLRKIDWLVYAKPPFGGPAQVLAYLARYTHRAANTRLAAVDDDQVAFTYKDYRKEGRRKMMRLAPDAFIRRLLLHVLPDGFHRIRHYGFPRQQPSRREDRKMPRVYRRFGAIHRKRARIRDHQAGTARQCHGLPRLRRSPAPHRPHRAGAAPRLSVRHVMIGPRHDRAASSAALHELRRGP